MKYETETQLVHELYAVINRFRLEYEVNYAQAIGCLEMVKLGLFKEANELEEEDNEE